MKWSMLHRASLGMILLAVTPPVWAQVDTAGAQPAATGTAGDDQKMATPPPVSVENYPLSFSSEPARRTYMSGGLRLAAAYDEILATAVKRQHGPQRVVGDLLAAEIAE